MMAFAGTSDTLWVPTEMLSWARRSVPQWFLFAHSMDRLRWILGQEATDVYAVGVKGVLFKLPGTWWGALRNLVDRALDGGELAISGHNGLAVVSMIEAVERSIEEQRPVVVASLYESETTQRNVES